MTHGEVIGTREIVDRLIANAQANGESADYQRALADVVDYDDRHAPHRAAAPEPELDLPVVCPETIVLWDAINAVVEASGGDPGNTSVRRQRAVVAVTDAVRTILGRYGEVGRAREMELALRNCLMLANLKTKTPPAKRGDWTDIIRFCAAAGVVPTILRGTPPAPEEPEEPATASLHLGDATWHGGPGWYYVDDNYPDEGSVGPFATRLLAVEHARAQDYLVDGVSPEQPLALEPPAVPATSERMLVVRVPESGVYSVSVKGPLNPSSAIDGRRYTAGDRAAVDFVATMPTTAATPPEVAAAAMDAVYTERTRLIALLAALCHSHGYRAGLGEHDPDDASWDARWRTIVFVEIPFGTCHPMFPFFQASWHVDDRDRHLVAHLPPYDQRWDGHTTEEKHQHMEQASRILAEGSSPACLHPDVLEFLADMIAWGMEGDGVPDFCEAFGRAMRARGWVAEGSTFPIPAEIKAVLERRRAARLAARRRPVTPP